VTGLRKGTATEGRARRAGSDTPEAVLSLRVHGIATATLCLASAAVAAAVALALPQSSGAVEPSHSEPATGGPAPAWPTSPYHGMISGATGEVIPCRCRFRGNAYRLGDTVCMSTHLGVQLARCDLMLNNTSWIPIGVPCTMSRLPIRQAVDARVPPTADRADGRSVEHKKVKGG
jgi:hypothetical protein